MNERQHIALTEAQIIAAEKGEIQLETRDGRKVVQFVWFREPCKQTDSNVLYSVLEDGEICFYPISGKRKGFDTSTIDLFVSEPDIDFSDIVIGAKSEHKDTTFIAGKFNTIDGIEYVALEDVCDNRCLVCDLGTESCKLNNIKCINTILKRVEQKPLYEFGENIEVNINGTWEEVEHIHNRNNNVVVWMNGQYHGFVGNLHRKKQTEKTVTLENKVMTVKEAFKYLTNL